MKGMEKLAVIILAGIVVASAFIATAQADPGKQKIKITCPAGINVVSISNGVASGVALPLACVGPGSTLNGILMVVGLNPFLAGSELDIDLISPAGLPAVTMLTAFITDDAASATKYHVDGSVGNEAVSYTDLAGNDKVKFNGKGGVNIFTVSDSASTDHYKGEKIDSIAGWLDAFPADGDKININ